MWFQQKGSFRKCWSPCPSHASGFRGQRRLTRARTAKRILRGSVSSFLLRRTWIFGLFWCWVPSFAIQELFFLFFLLLLCRALRIERFHLAFLRGCQLGQVSYEHDKFPTVIVFLFRTPCWHTGQSKAVMNGV